MLVRTDLNDPCKDEFVEAINTVGENEVSQEQIDGAWEAITAWPRGSLTTFPYGNPVPKYLVVQWEGSLGYLKIDISRI